METDLQHTLLESNRTLGESMLNLAQSQLNMMDYWERTVEGLRNDNRFLREQLALALERRAKRNGKTTKPTKRGRPRHERAARNSR